MASKDESWTCSSSLLTARCTRYQAVSAPLAYRQSSKIGVNKISVLMFSHCTLAVAMQTATWLWC